MIKFVVYFHCFLSENGQFLFKILYSIIGWKHFLLLFGFVLDFREFFLNFLDVISVSKQKLCFMFFYHMFHLRIHVIYCGVDLIVEFMNLLDRFFIVKVSRIVLWGVLLAGILCSDHEWRVLVLFGWFGMKDRRRGLVRIYRWILSARLRFHWREIWWRLKGLINASIFIFECKWLIITYKQSLIGVNC